MPNDVIIEGVYCMGSYGLVRYIAWHGISVWYNMAWHWYVWYVQYGIYGMVHFQQPNSPMCLCVFKILCR